MLSSHAVPEEPHLYILDRGHISAYATLGGDIGADAEALGGQSENVNLAKGEQSNPRHRLAKYGAGAILGVATFVTPDDMPGLNIMPTAAISDTYCQLLRLSRSRCDDLERLKPALIFRLYRLLVLISERRLQDHRMRVVASEAFKINVRPSTNFQRMLVGSSTLPPSIAPNDQIVQIDPKSRPATIAFSRSSDQLLPIAPGTALSAQMGAMPPAGAPSSAEGERTSRGLSATDGGSSDERTAGSGGGGGGYGSLSITVGNGGSGGGGHHRSGSHGDGAPIDADAAPVECSTQASDGDACTPRWSYDAAFGYRASDVELRSRRLVLSLHHKPWPSFGAPVAFGTVTLSLMDIALGPSKYDLPVLSPSGEPNGRIVFHIRMVQQCRMSILVPSVSCTMRAIAKHTSQASREAAHRESSYALSATITMAGELESAPTRADFDHKSLKLTEKAQVQLQLPGADFKEPRIGIVVQASARAFDSESIHLCVWESSQRAHMETTQLQAAGGGATKQPPAGARGAAAAAARRGFGAKQKLLGEVWLPVTKVRVCPASVISRLGHRPTKPALRAPPPLPHLPRQPPPHHPRSNPHRHHSTVGGAGSQPEREEQIARRPLRRGALASRPAHRPPQRHRALPQRPKLCAAARWLLHGGGSGAGRSHRRRPSVRAR